MSQNYEELHQQYQKTVAERDRLIKEAEEAKAALLAIKQAEVEKRIANMSEEEKAYIIAHTEHTRSSCSDENPCNGYHGDSYLRNEGFRCPKCMLMEILNGEHGGAYDFRLSFEIFKVTV